MTTSAKKPAPRPEPTVRPPSSRAADRLAKAALFPLILGTCSGMTLLVHRTGAAAALAVLGIGAALALGTAAAVCAVRATRLNPWPGLIVAAVAGGSAAWLLLPLAGLSWLRIPAAFAAAAAMAKMIPAALCAHRRRKAYHRWAQALAPELTQSIRDIEQVLAGITHTPRISQQQVTAPHFGMAPHAAWNLRITSWNGPDIRQASLVLPTHSDISNPDFLEKIRDALKTRAGVKYLKASPDPLRDTITITVLDGPEKTAKTATVRERAIERVKTVTEMALRNVEVIDADIDEDTAAQIPEGEGIAGAGHALREFTISFDPAKIVTRPESRAGITEHISTQLFGEPDRLRQSWDVSQDRATFKLRRIFPEFIPHPVLDLAALYPGRVVLPYGEDEDGNLAGYPLSKTTLPHGMVIGPTGGGKTQLLVLIAIEAARQGVEVWGLDPKMIELLGLRGWPNVTKVAYLVPDMAKLIADAHTEMYKRFKEIATGKVRRGHHRRLLIILDEYFIFCMLVAAWWKAERSPGDAKEPPAIQQVAELLALSRGANINVVIGIQRPDSTFFYEGARDNIGWRVSLGRLSPQGAMMVWQDSRTGTDLPLDVPGLATATTVNGPARVKVHWVPNPADALGDGLSDEEMALLRSLLPPGSSWDGPLPADAPDPGFEDSAAIRKSITQDPATGFLSLIRYALSSRTAHMTASPGGGPPAAGADAGLYGWGPGPGGQQLERSGTWIGSIEETPDGRRAYLHPQRAYQVASKFAQELAETFDATREDVDQAMRRSGLLKTEKTKTETKWTVRRNLPGNDLDADRPRVWDIPAEALIATMPATPAGAAPAQPACSPPAIPAGPLEPPMAPALPGPAEKPAGHLADGDRIVLIFEDGEVMEVTVCGIDPDPTTSDTPERDGTERIVIHYIGDTGSGYVRARIDHPIRLVTPGDGPGGALTS